MPRRILLQLSHVTAGWLLRAVPQWAQNPFCIFSHLVFQSPLEGWGSCQLATSWSLAGLNRLGKSLVGLGNRTGIAAEFSHSPRDTALEISLAGIYFQVSVFGIGKALHDLSIAFLLLLKWIEGFDCIVSGVVRDPFSVLITEWTITVFTDSLSLS